MTSYRALARNHDFTVLWVGETISTLGSRMSMFVFPLLAYALSGSAVLAALAETAHLLGVVLTLLPGGVLADRHDRRRLMRAASGGGVLLYTSLAAAGALGVLTVPHLLVVALLTGACAGVFAPAELAAVRTVVPADQLPTALSQTQAREHVAGLLGGPVGGALYGLTRWLPFAVDAVSFAVSWVLLGRIRSDLSAPATPTRTGLRAGIAEGARFVWSRPLFRTLLIWSALANLSVNAVFFVAVLRLIQDGIDPLHLGLIETVAGAAGLVGAALAPWIIDRVPTGRLTVLIGWSFLPLLVPMALVDSPVVVAAALATIMVLNPAGNAGIGAYRLAVTPDDVVARVQSFSRVVGQAALPLAPVLGGAALAVLGGTQAVLAVGTLVAAAALVPTLSGAVRSVPRPAEWPTSEAAGSTPQPTRPADGVPA